jgi:penicillin-binding protein 1A
MQEAFTRSLNIPAIQIGLSLGLPKIYEVSSRLGVYPKPKNLDISCQNDEVSTKYCRNYSLLLGAFETTLMKLTAAYATIASYGYQVDPSLINSIYDSNGKLLYREQNTSLFGSNEECKMKFFKQKLIKKDANAKILELMQNAVAPQAKELKIPIAGKTGTTNDSLDSWFIGSSSDFTVGVFIGYDMPQSLGKKEIGATVARPVFMTFMKSLDIKASPIAQKRECIEMINTDDELEDEINEELQTDQFDLDAINAILKKPEIDSYLRECPDCEDAFRVNTIN